MKSATKHTSSLATPVQYVKGVGPALAERLKRMGIYTVSDLLYVVPHRYRDRRRIIPFSELVPGDDQTVLGTVARSGVAFVGRRRKRIYEVVIDDQSGRLVSLKWFVFQKQYFEQRYRVGTKLLASGDATQFGSVIQFIHPEIELVTDEVGGFESAGKILPLYPLTEGLHQKTMRKIIRNAWTLAQSEIVSALPRWLVDEFHIADTRSSLEMLHFPSDEEDVDRLNERRSTAHRTLIFDECFYLALGLELKRHGMQTEPGIAFPPRQELEDRFLSALPFSFTAAQERVSQEILADMEKRTPMNRLLQGDVGSGKTVVATRAAVRAIGCGHQVAVMAPTEILAQQHFTTMRKMLQGIIAEPCLLTNAVKGSERQGALERIAGGETALVVGTHALIQERVAFHNLGLVIVDEQHRFGVLQRQALRNKGVTPDVLVMTATPIPRTLAMTVYGDLDLSVIDELPRGRKPIITKLYSEAMRHKLYAGILHELELGRQAYVIYPLIEESEKVDLKHATGMAEEIRTFFARSHYNVALVHGRMKGEEKDATMRDFKEGKVHILVSTSVVEVGVDVPNASVMVIEHAERFGLSQLHQLRGRVGRSEHQSYCILVADYRRSPEAEQRLKIMTETTDGFRIAEEDLAIRGPGEFIGTRQAGIPPFRLMNLARDAQLFARARETASRLLAEDPQLSKPEHRLLRESLVARWAGRLDLARVS